MISPFIQQYSAPLNAADNNYSTLLNNFIYILIFFTQTLTPYGFTNPSSLYRSIRMMRIGARAVFIVSAHRGGYDWTEFDYFCKKGYI
jgi:hypothetical protein